MGYETVLYDVADSVAWITLNRPDSLNALDGPLSSDLTQALRDAAGDPAVRCVVLTGAGRAFCSGADLTQLEPYYEKGEPPPVAAILRERYNPMIEPIVTMEKPVVAMVNGVAAGAGASLALACDFRIAADNARFFQAFVKVGLVPDSGATYFLPRLVGVAKAMELAMLGDIVGAEEAARIGLVTKVVPAGSLRDETAAFAERLAQGATRAIGLTKRAIYFGANGSLHAALDYEADLQDQLGKTADHREGVQAFLAKRAPAFTGH